MSRWKQIDPNHTQELQLDLLEEARSDRPYLSLIISSCAIATFGLLSNSAAVIIGAMIIAPLMLPIRALAFGALIGNYTLFRRGTLSVAIGTGIAILLSCFLGWISGIVNFGSEILARTQPTLLDLGIAIAAGAIGGYGKIEPKVSSTAVGTAIAVALMPPICVIGLGLSQGDINLSKGAALLYLTNLLGITLSCMLVFLAIGYAPLRQAQKPLIAALALTSALFLPLGWRFSLMVQQARLENSLKRALLNKTVTFQRLDLVNVKSNWLTTPPQVRLTVFAKEPVTAKQVELLEEFIAREIGKSFSLIFIVNYVEEVDRVSGK